MRTIVGLERHGRSLRGMLSAVLVGAALMGTANAGVPARETALWCDPACGAIVADWGLAAYATIRADNGYQNPLPASRALAAMHLAMHDAINAAASRYARYVAASDAATPTGPVPADPAAAAIVAAHDVLLGLYPSQQAQLAAALDDLAGSLLWRIGRLADDAPVTVRVGFATSAAIFGELPRLRNASDDELLAAVESGDLRVEWVGPRNR